MRRRPARRVNPPHRHTRKYNSRGQLTAIRDSLGRETRYDYNEAGDLTTITGPDGSRTETQYDGRGNVLSTTRGGLTRRMAYDAAGRVTQLTNENGSHSGFTWDALDRLTEQTGFDGRTQRYGYDPAFYPQSSSTVWADNRITEDMQYRYRYDCYGRLTEKTDRIPEGVIRMHDERTHRYDYDSQHRLVRYVRTQYGETQAEGRYVYDPTGRRVGKRVWKREPVHWSETRTELSARPYETWYGWEGDRLTTVQTQQRRVQTVYAPGSFTPLLRVETENTELAKTRHRSLAEKLEQEGSGDGEAVQFPAALRAMLDRLEDELRRDAVSEESRAWLTQCGLTAEQMKNQLEPRPEPERKVHLYHCDHRGLPLALISPDNTVAWRAEYDEWGNQLSEDNPAQLEQLIRLPGQQYDDESGLYYNRHRYYSPGQGRYITQDPIGLAGGWNPYIYPLNPVSFVDFLGLQSNPLDQDEELNNREYGGYQENQCCSFLSLHDRDINVKIYDLMPFPGGAMKGPRTEWLDRKLPSDKYGNIIPDKDIPHTQLGMRIGRRKTYMQAREWGYDEQGKLIPKRLIDFTDYGRNDHTNPHQHTYEPNSTGGTWRHGKQCEVE